MRVFASDRNTSALYDALLVRRWHGCLAQAEGRNARTGIVGSCYTQQSSVIVQETRCHNMLNRVWHYNIRDCHTTANSVEIYGLMMNVVFFCLTASRDAC